jgi:uncharacterized protein DUF1559
VGKKDLMARKQFTAGVATAAIFLAGFLIFDFFRTKPRKLPVSSPSDLAGPQIRGVGQGLVTGAVTTRRIPAVAICDENGKPLLSWRVAILPYLQRFDLYSEFNRDEPWDSEHNKPLIDKMPEFYRSPFAGDLKGKTVYLVPTGPQTIFSNNEPVSLSQITDGPRETIVLVEVDVDHAVPWTKPEDLPIDPNDPAAGLARCPGGVVLVVSADGEVHMPPANTDPAALWGFFTRAGGEKLDWPY